MSHPFAVLDLPHDADERAIRRAYATKLRITRPDEDPQGFQRLNEAYRAALRIASARATREPGDGEADLDIVVDGAPETPREATLEEPAAQPAAQPAGERVEEHPPHTRDQPPAKPLEEAPRAPSDAPQQPTPADVFDAEAFHDRLVGLLTYSREGELQRWLDAQPVLWSLTDKMRILDWMLHRLHERQPPVSGAQFDRFARYFGLDDLHAGYDAFALRRLRERLHLVWMVRTDQLRALAERTHQRGTSLISAVRATRRAMRQLTRPLSWPQALFASLFPGHPSAIRRFLHALDRGNLRDLPPPIRPEQVAFWEAAADRTRLSKPRAALLLARCFAYALLGTLLAAISAGATDGHVAPAALAGTFAVWLAVLATGWAAAHFGQTFVRWQCRPDPEARRARALHSMAIPVVVAISMLLSSMAPLNALGALSGVIALVTAWRRYRARGGAWMDALPTLGTWVLVPILLGLVLASVVPAVAPRAFAFALPAVALALWSVDRLRLFRRR